MIQKNILPISYNNWIDFYFYATNNIKCINNTYIVNIDSIKYAINLDFLYLECFKELILLIKNTELITEKFINEKLLILLYNESSNYKTNLNQKNISNLIKILNLMCKFAHN